MKFIYKKDDWIDISKALGLVFGDIGTSPIYTMTVIFLLVRPSPENILGILSLIIWTMILIVFVQYTILAMNLSVHGEGGTIILKKILEKLMKPGRKAGFMTVLAYFGVSLLLGDGVITPSISILSAVEGIKIIPGLEWVYQSQLLFVAIIIAVVLFIIQSKGTDKVAGAFGPIMIVWFIALAVSGFVSITYAPEVIDAINPAHAVEFFGANGIAGFFILSEVILCATGAEALYADMGHIGKRPIVRAWYLVFVTLVLNYLGQGAFLLKNPEAKNLLFSMVQWEAPVLYIPFLVLTIVATVIASQALISGVFSIIYQAINTRAFPRMKVDFTSFKLKSQIYIGTANWALMAAVIFIMLLFEKSENLAVAYGLAVTGTMFITGIMMMFIFHYNKQHIKLVLAAMVTFIDFSFLIANLIKLKHGGYWSLILASIPFSIILLWIYGHRRVYSKLRPIDLDTFLISYKQVYSLGKNIPGCALFFSGSRSNVSPYIIHSIFRSGIIYEHNIFINIFVTDLPFGIDTHMNEQIEQGLSIFEVRTGYMEEIDIDKIINKAGINPKVIFYGVEDITTNSLVWEIFAAMKKLSQTFVRFYKIPAEKLQGVITKLEI